ncbi:MAG: hypothetical protein AUK55_10025 [Syntrophobacteraceae bacterium CG2_30_61_12]|nr:MAG: hypothetical protein AUK55_10025 [Syntrophobacteraceae bacterium CG2_30_61_12]
MRDREFWLGRFGCYRRPVTRGAPRLWLHASSVGEVTGAMATVLEIRRRLPHSNLVLTVSTPQGFRFARTQLRQWVQVYAPPLDLPWPVWSAVSHFRPDLFVGFESEFWPLLFWMLRRRDIPTLLLNGRLSDRSARTYHRFPTLFQPLFRHFTGLAMNSEADARNILSFGVSADRVRVLGSSKYDTLEVRTGFAPSRDWRNLLGWDHAGPVVIGGSLRRRECIWLLDVFAALAETRADLLGLFVPRHLHRIEEMTRHLTTRSIGFQLLSRLIDGTEVRREPVVLVDRIGVLFELYALGDLIFCGGTLEPIGGHNIVEPAAWGKRVVYGPHVEKVAREHELLQRHQASVMVSDWRQLIRLWQDQLSSQVGHTGTAEAPLGALRELGGVAQAQVDLILEALHPDE